MDPELRAAVGRIARVPQLLVACDYDGTLAPIVDDPPRRSRCPGGRRRPRAGRLPQTTVAVVSGRALRDLAALSRLPSEVHLVGSHGSEFDVGFVERLAPGAGGGLRTRLPTRSPRSPRTTGGTPRAKPASVAVHTRGVGPRASPPRSSTRSAAGRRPGPRPRHRGQEGHRAVGGRRHKGTAVDAAAHAALGQRGAVPRRRRDRRERLRNLHGPTSASRSAPARPGPQYRVGRADRGRPGARAAAGDPPATGSSASGRCRSSGTRCSPTAVPSRWSRRTPRSPGCATRGRTPRRSSPTCSAALAGHFTVAPGSASGIPLGPALPRGTMTVETRWSGLTVTDWLDRGPDPPDNPAASRRLWSGCSPAPAGPVEFAPRPEFGQVTSQLQPLGDGLLVLGSNDPMALLLPRRRVGRHRRRRLRDRPRRWSTSPPPAARCVLELRFGTADLSDQPGRRWRTGWPRPSSRGGTGRPRCGCPRGPGPGAAQRADPARAVPRADRLDPRRGDHLAARGDRRHPQLGLPLLLAARRRDDRPGAGRPRLARARPRRCCAGSTGASSAPAGTRSGCTRSTPSTATSSAPRRSSTPCPGTPAPGRYGSATPPTASSSSTCSARSPT